MTKIPHVTQNMSIDHDDFCLLIDIQSRYHLKNPSQALHKLVWHYKILIAEHEVTHKPLNNPPRKPLMNPQVMA